MTLRIPLLVLLCGFANPVVTSAQEVVYQTNFDEFVSGADAWAGQDGWVGTSTNTASHGLDTEQVPGLGNTAFIGFGRPDRSFVSMIRPLPMSPLTEETGDITLRTLVGIRDSSNDRRDAFHVFIANQSGQLLASVQLDNRDTSFGIWRLDGSRRTDTSFNFLRGELHDLRLVISFPRNRWTAFLDGIPLFEDEVFHAGDLALNIGGFGVAWELSSDPANNGDNWMLVADWRVETGVPLRERLAFTRSSMPLPDQLVFQARASGRVQLEQAGSLNETQIWQPVGGLLNIRAGQTIRLPVRAGEDGLGFWRSLRVAN